MIGAGFLEVKRLFFSWEKANCEMKNGAGKIKKAVSLLLEENSLYTQI
jgi:hypothetical protein